MYSNYLYMKPQLFRLAMCAALAFCSVHTYAQEPSFVEFAKHTRSPSKGVPLYVETTKYLKYAPGKGHEEKQIRYDKVGRMWLTFSKL